MPDQSTPVTNDTARKIHAWCDEKASHEAMDATEYDIVRYLRATIPKPPTALAELEEVKGYLSEAYRQRDAKDAEVYRLEEEVSHIFKEVEKWFGTEKANHIKWTVRLYPYFEAMKEIADGLPDYWKRVDDLEETARQEAAE